MKCSVRGVEIKIDRSDAHVLDSWNWYLYDKYVIGNVKIDGKWRSIFLHRFLMNAKSGQQVDHKNRDTLDNRRKNLRLCTPRENSLNTKKKKSNRSGIPCLAKYNGMWKVFKRMSDGKRVQKIFKLKKDAIAFLNTFK